jgi:GTPase SAR1 family protein
MKQNGFTGSAWLFDEGITCPGLTPGAGEIYGLAQDLPKRLAVSSYKQNRPYLWVVFMGGTGTGKSTLFNAFCGKALSETGVERPKTSGPIAYVHRDRDVEKGFPFPSIEIERLPWEEYGSGPVSGKTGRLVILGNQGEECAHLAVVDTPDLDSVEAVNREAAQDLYLLSDVVVFVTSQEKYADEVPYQLLLKIREDKRPYFFLLNKAQEGLTKNEVTGILESQGLRLKEERIWLIPHAPSGLFDWISDHPSFHDFKTTLSRELAAEKVQEFRNMQRLRRVEDLKSRLDRLIRLMREENRAAGEWMDQLDALCRSTVRYLIAEQKEQFSADSRQYLQREIRRLFTRYDVFARPRHFVREVLLTPLRLLGFLKKDNAEYREQGLLKIRQKMDLTPVQIAILRFNRSVLEKLSPAHETSPLFNRIRAPGVILDEEEVKQHIWRKQDQMATWLGETFQKLSQGIPKGKQLGIYSTSILWGVLILSFEAVVGGGFTVLDTALDAALAPFVTKGAVELFAYHEIRKIARELAKRYQEGLISIIRLQRDRYEGCLKSLMTPLEGIEKVRHSLEAGTVVGEEVFR